MKVVAWLWGGGCLLIILTSALGLLIRISPVLLAVPAAVFAVGAAAFCFGRPGLPIRDRVLSCLFAVLVVVAATTHLPLRASFVALKSDFETNALAALDGTLVSGTWIGCFRLCGSQVDPDGTVYLWTISTRQGNAGFVKSTATSVVGSTTEIELGHGWRYAYFSE